MKLHRLAAILTLGLILGAYRGYLALWNSDSILPLTVYPYKIEHFPPEEQQRLLDGITVPDEAKLDSLLQDYLS